MEWKDIKSAPKKKDVDYDHVTGPEILATDGFKVRTIWWTTEYPCTEGVWCQGYSHTDYIDEINQFYPILWMELPEIPNVKKTT